mgnify:CR=1 FL=1
MHYNKIEKNRLAFVVVLQFVVILFLAYYIVASPSPKTSSAQEPTFSEQITNDAKICLSLTPEERPACAKAAGVKIGAHTQVPGERLVECLKFQPYYVHDCQLGLSAGQ